MKKDKLSKTIIGWREWIELPALGGVLVKAKVDTGARTSAIHAWNIKPITIEGVACVQFDLHPLQRNNQFCIACTAPIVDVRSIKNSGGQARYRYIVQTLITLGQSTWPIELSLTNRDEMGFRMLLGRAALQNTHLVDPGRSFLASHDSSQTNLKAPERRKRETTLQGRRRPK